MCFVTISTKCCFLIPAAPNPLMLCFLQYDLSISTFHESGSPEKSLAPGGALEAVPEPRKPGPEPGPELVPELVLETASGGMDEPPELGPKGLPSKSTLTWGPEAIFVTLHQCANVSF